MADSEMKDDATERAVRRPVLLIILDGFGFNPRSEAAILAAACEHLPADARAQVVGLARAALGEATGDSIPDKLLLRLVLSPVFPTVATRPEFDAIPWATLRAVYGSARDTMAQTTYEDEMLLDLVHRTISDLACRAHYPVWCARSPYIDQLRNGYPTVITQASGLAAGYEDLVPAVQGNSETGHQQIGNFIVAAQVPLEISTEIADGRFFENPVLRECLAEVKQRGSSLDICFLLSGEYGDDGRVHSCWNHLEATLEAAFVRAKLPPSRVRIEAILDGRDSPPTSSVERSGDRYGFLFKLRDLLARHNATESLAWVIGRSVAMDRDYEESRAKQDYALLVEGNGKRVADIDAAIEAVRQHHADGYRDTSMPPISVGAEVRRIEDGDVFLDLNFRADRQREKVAWLLGARDFLQREAAAKGQRWNLNWLALPKNLAVYCLSEYHPELAAHYGARILYPIRPQPHNLLALLAEQSVAQGFPFHYLLTAESTKALHVGYFIRGRRETPVEPEEEERRILPSYGPEFGVATDDDYYKTPQMRAFALADVVVESLAGGRFDVIAVNLSNTDMVGHLMPRRYAAAVRSVTLIDTVLATMVPAALRNGYAVVLTADHGNVEDNDSSHTTNDILTTFISPDQELRLRHDPREPARLFDIPWSILEIMGLTDRIIPHLPPIPAKIREQALVGRSLVEVLVPVPGD
jgi:2,3-bisphosphoglycerate-independent phosphoglycerate mutase